MLEKHILKSLPSHARITYGLHLFKALTKQHHKELKPLLQQNLSPDSVIIDVGAHAGQFTKLFSRLCPKGKVYAIEPAGYTRSILKKVVSLHGLKNVSIIHEGFSDQQAVRTLHIPIKSSGSLGYGLSHLGDNASQNNTPTYKEDVTLKPLDQFIDEEKIQRVDMIKADIEGWEMRMLAGAKETIARFKPVLMLEVNRRFLDRAGDTPEDIWAFLKEHGYKIEQLVFENNGTVTTAPAPNPVEGDIICTQ